LSEDCLSAASSAALKKWKREWSQGKQGRGASPEKYPKNGAPITHYYCLHLPRNQSQSLLLIFLN
ncbi:MAG: hypothetical protein MK319_06635, partial [Pseudomonadales bacterium]|nr:hypothetical protein [Pseudomonadales bacterium]